METLKFKTRIGRDGILKLEMPSEITNEEVEVTVTIEAVNSIQTDANGWPIGYFDTTYGSFAENPIERGEQGELDIRDPLT